MPYCIKYPGPDDSATADVAGVPRAFPRGVVVAMPVPTEGGRLIRFSGFERVPTDDPAFGDAVPAETLEVVYG